MCECRIYAQAKREYSDPGKHLFLITDFKCPICDLSRFNMHGNDGDYGGFTYECERCREYIIYFHNDHKFFKDEFYYLDSVERKETVIVRYNDHFFVEMGLKDFTCPLFEFKNKEELLNKIKTYILYQ